MSEEKIGLHNLQASPGSHRNRKRLGRGPGSGTGKTSGKGHKGIKARSGHHGHGGNKPHFEGGQMPITGRVPRGGLRKPFRVESQVVSIHDLAELPKDSVVTRESLVAAGLIKTVKGPAKLLANGDITHAITVRGIKVSGAARDKIVAAGGTVEE